MSTRITLEGTTTDYLISETTHEKLSEILSPEGVASEGRDAYIARNVTEAVLTVEFRLKLMETPAERGDRVGVWCGAYFHPSNDYLYVHNPADAGTYTYISEVKASDIVRVWHQITLTFTVSGANVVVKAYVDGIYKGTGTLLNYTLLTAYNCFIGRSAGYLGRVIVKDYRLWNVVRTATQIADNYNSNLVGNESGLLALLPCVEGVNTNSYLPQAIFSNSFDNANVLYGTSFQAYSGSAGIFNTYPLTIMGWVYCGAFVATNTSSPYIGLRDGAGNLALTANISAFRRDTVSSTTICIAYGCRQTAGVGIGRTYKDTGVPLDSLWHHIAVVCVSASLRHYYFDGAYVGTETTANALPAGAMGLWIGDDPGQSTCNGGAKQVLVYRRSFTHAEIQAQAVSAVPLITDNLVGFLPVNETAGGVVADLSGNGFNCTLVGGARAKITPKTIDLVSNKSLVSAFTDRYLLSKTPYFNNGARIVIPASATALLTNSNPRTISIRFLFNSADIATDHRMLFSYGAWGTKTMCGVSVRRQSVGGPITIGIYFYAYDHSTAALPEWQDNSWNTATLTIDDLAVARLYLNNKLKITVNTTGLATTSTALILGSMQDGTYGAIKGYLADCFVYSRGLSLPELVLQDAARTPISTASLQGFWSLDENSGTSALDISDNSRHGVYNTPVRHRLTANDGTLTGSPVWNFETQQTGEVYQGRLTSTPVIEARNSRNTVEKMREVPLGINNRDGWLDVLNENLWGKQVTIEQDGVSETWSGNISFYKQNAKGVLSLTVTEKSVKELSQLIPDEALRVGTWANMEASFTNSVIPLPFGGTRLDPLRVMGMVADRVAFRYIFCSGEIQWYGKVFSNNVELVTGFTVYTGSATQAVYPGFVYIEFTADPRDDAGAWPTVIMEITGVKFGTSTEDECRNPIRMLQYLMTTANTGVNGWGLGIAASRLDSAAFTAAIADCDAASLKLDGILTERRDGLTWITEILKSCRGKLPTINGKYYPIIDKAQTAGKTFTSANMELIDWGKENLSKRINRVMVDYRYKLGFSSFDYAGYAVREDSTSQVQIGEIEKTITLKLVSDHATAGALADYELYRSAYTEDIIRFRTVDIAGLSNGLVISISYVAPGFSVSSKLYRIFNLIPGVTGCRPYATIEAEAYDDAIFTVNPIGTLPADPIVDSGIHGPSVGLAAEIVTDFVLSTGTSTRIDGTQQVYIDGTYTKGRNFAFAEIQYSQDGGVSWQSRGTTPNAGFRVDPVNPGKSYRFRVLAIGASGKQALPVEASNSPITAAGGTTAPADIAIFSVVQDTFDLDTIHFSWEPVEDVDIMFYEIRKGVDWDTAERIGLQLTGTTFSFNETSNGIFSYQIKAIDKNWKYSVNAALRSLTVYICPADVTGFNAVQNGSKLLLFWQANNDLNVKSYEIRQGTSWDFGQLFVENATSTTLEFPANFERAYTFWIKAKSDKLVYSLNASQAGIDIAGLLPKNYVVLKDEVASPTGVFNSTVIETSAGTFDQNSNQFSDYPLAAFDDFPTGSVLHLGHLTDTIPTPVVYDEILSPTGTHNSTEISAATFTIDNMRGNFEDYGEVTFSDLTVDRTMKLVNTAGVYPLSGSYLTEYSLSGIKVVHLAVDLLTIDLPLGSSCILEIRTSNDHATWSDWEIFVDGEKAGKHFQFRLTFNSTSIFSSPEVLRYVLTMSPGTGSTVFYNTGTYTASYDIGQVATCALAVDMRTFIQSYDVTVVLEFRYSLDGISWGAWEVFTQSTRTFRYLEFRVTLTTLDNEVSPEVTQLIIAIDVPDVDQRGTQVVPLAGIVVTYPIKYNFVPALVVTAEGVDAYAEYATTETNFTVQVKKVSDGSPLDGYTVNWISRGF